MYFTMLCICGICGGVCTPNRVTPIETAKVGLPQVSILIETMFHVHVHMYSVHDTWYSVWKEMNNYV